MTTNPIKLETRYGAANYLPLPVTLTRGEGSYLWDTEGRRYLDMMSAYSAVSFGHAHPELVAVLREQAGRLAVRSQWLCAVGKPEQQADMVALGVGALGPPVALRGLERVDGEALRAWVPAGAAARTRPLGLPPSASAVRR